MGSPNVQSGNSENIESDEKQIAYDIDDEPPLIEAIPLALQHMLAMILSTVVVPLIILNSIGATSAQTTFVIQMALLMAGIATIVQAYSVGPVGARLPIIMGTSSIFIVPLIDIGNSFGLAAIFAAVIVTGPIEIVIGYYYDSIRKLFPPLVTGIVITLIGILVIDVAMGNAGGGPGTDGFGSLTNLGIAGLILVLSVGLNQFTDGIVSIASVFIALVIGYLLAAALGLVDFSPVAEADWVAVPTPLSFGLEFHLSAIVLAAFGYVIGAMETIGDVEGTTRALDREATEKEMSGALIADGVMSSIAGVFNAFPNTSFSQNVGLISFTGVASRFVVAICGVFLIILGFVPKLAALVTAMPDPVIGGAVIVLFGMIIAIGISVISQAELNRRNQIVIAISLVLGVGVEIEPGVVGGLPEDLQILAGSGIIVGGVTAILLNLILPDPEQTAAP